MRANAPTRIPRHDDRRALFVAATLAVVIHFLAIFIPLPAAPQPPLAIERSSIVFNELVLRPPRLPERVPEIPAAAVRRNPIPVPELQDQALVIDPRWADEASSEMVVIDDDIPFAGLGDGEPPPAPAGPVGEDTAGLILPVKLDCPATIYPAMARTIKKTGTVVLDAVVDKLGHVVELKVVSAPQPDFGLVQAAVDGLERCRYTPGELNGRPVAVRLRVNVEFNLY